MYRHRQRPKVYALPFAISLPIVYVNLDLLKQAGGDPANLPKTWDELIPLAKKIKALGNDVNGVTYVGTSPATGCGRRRCSRAAATMLNAEETKVAFNGPEGQFAIRTLARLVTDGGMPNSRQGRDARRRFAAGKTGFHVTSTSDLNKVTQMVDGKFALKTSPSPMWCRRTAAAGGRQTSC